VKDLAVIGAIIGGVAIFVFGGMELWSRHRVNQINAAREAFYREHPDLAPEYQRRQVQRCLTANGVPVLTGRFPGDYARIACVAKSEHATP
jgi:hypothetical protein